MIVSLSIPETTVSELDRLIKDLGYKGRSELVRAALRDFIKLNEQEQRVNGHLNAVVILGYPEEMERDLSEVRHRHNDLVKSMLHAHSSSQTCTTILQCEGADQRLRRFLAELRGLRRLASIQVTIV